MLLVRVNGNKDLVGRNALFTGASEPVANNDHLMRVRFRKDKLLAEYVSAFLRTPFDAYGNLDHNALLRTVYERYPAGCGLNVIHIMNRSKPVTIKVVELSGSPTSVLRIGTIFASE
jgi:hypothetical protein